VRPNYQGTLRNYDVGCLDNFLNYFFSLARLLLIISICSALIRSTIFNCSIVNRSFCKTALHKQYHHARPKHGYATPKGLFPDLSYNFNQCTSQYISTSKEKGTDFSGLIIVICATTGLLRLPKKHYYKITCTSFPRHRATLARKSRDGLYVPLSRRLILDF